MSYRNHQLDKIQQLTETLSQKFGPILEPFDILSGVFGQLFSGPMQK